MPKSLEATTGNVMPHTSACMCVTGGVHGIVRSTYRLVWASVGIRAGTLEGEGKRRCVAHRLGIDGVPKQALA